MGRQGRPSQLDCDIGPLQRAGGRIDMYAAMKVFRAVFGRFVLEASEWSRSIVTDGLSTCCCGLTDSYQYVSTIGDNYLQCRSSLNSVAVVVATAVADRPLQSTAYLHHQLPLEMDHLRHRPGEGR